MSQNHFRLPLTHVTLLPAVQPWPQLHTSLSAICLSESRSPDLPYQWALWTLSPSVGGHWRAWCGWGFFSLPPYPACPIHQLGVSVWAYGQHDSAISAVLAERQQQHWNVSMFTPTGLSLKTWWVSTYLICTSSCGADVACVNGQEGIWSLWKVRYIHV